MSLANTLHSLIGLEFNQQDKQCTLIEVIEDGPWLVVQCESEKTIQPNQHGNANRRSHPTYTIHCLNEFKTDLHPVLKAALPQEQHQPLLELLLQIDEQQQAR